MNRKGLSPEAIKFLQDGGDPIPPDPKRTTVSVRIDLTKDDHDAIQGLLGPKADRKQTQAEWLQSAISEQIKRQLRLMKARMKQ